LGVKQGPSKKSDPESPRGGLQNHQPDRHRKEQTRERAKGEGGAKGWKKQRGEERQTKKLGLQLLRRITKKHSGKIGGSTGTNKNTQATGKKIKVGGRGKFAEGGCVKPESVKKESARGGGKTKEGTKVLSANSSGGGENEKKGGNGLQKKKGQQKGRKKGGGGEGDGVGRGGHVPCPKWGGWGAGKS